MSRIMLATFFGASALSGAVAAFAPQTEQDKSGIGPVTEVAAEVLPKISTLPRVLAGTYGLVGVGCSALFVVGNALENRDKRRKAAENPWDRDSGFLYGTTSAMARFTVEVVDSKREVIGQSGKGNVNVKQIVLGLNEARNMARSYSGGGGFSLAFVPSQPNAVAPSRSENFLRLVGLTPEPPEPEADAHVGVFEAKALAEAKGVRFYQVYGGEWRAELPPVVN